jgi:hypothetical protein
VIATDSACVTDAAEPGSPVLALVDAATATVFECVGRPDDTGAARSKRTREDHRSAEH